MVFMNRRTFIFKIYQVLLISSLAFCSYSCKKESFEDFTLKNNENNLVVFSLISPNKDVIVNIRKVMSINKEENYNLGQNYDDIKGAIVILKCINNGLSDTLREYAPSVYFLENTKLKVEKGLTYRLDIFYKAIHLTSECTVPQKSFQGKVTDINFNPSQKVGLNSFDENITINYFLKKEGTSKNVFLIESRKSFNDSNMQIDSLKREIYFDPYFVLNNSYLIIIPTKGFNFKKKEVNYILATTTKEVSDYFEQIYNQDRQRALFEKTPIFAFNSVFPQLTNIKGGNGIFGAYIVSSASTVAIIKNENKYYFSSSDINL